MNVPQKDPEPEMKMLSPSLSAADKFKVGSKKNIPTVKEAKSAVTNNFKSTSKVAQSSQGKEAPKSKASPVK